MDVIYYYYYIAAAPVCFVVVIKLGIFTHSQVHISSKISSINYAEAVFFNSYKKSHFVCAKARPNHFFWDICASWPPVSPLSLLATSTW